MCDDHQNDRADSDQQADNQENLSQPPTAKAILTNALLTEILAQLGLPLILLLLTTVVGTVIFISAWFLVLLIPMVLGIYYVIKKPSDKHEP